MRRLFLASLTALALAGPACAETEQQTFLRELSRIAPFAGSWKYGTLSPRDAEFCYCPERGNEVGQLLVTIRQGADRLLRVQVLCGVPRFMTVSGDMWDTPFSNTCERFIVLPSR